MQTNDTAWVTIARSPAVTAEVERALYESPGSPHFFVHVRVTNTAGRPLGMDLRKWAQVLYPNQWGASKVDHREVIDERRVILGPFDAAPTIADFRAGALAKAAIGASLDYYAEFNASGRPDVDSQATERWVVVVMDGQLRWSDGDIAERLVPDESSREIAISAPVGWKPIPAGARAIVASGS
jgi:hypothetical protein